MYLTDLKNLMKQTQNIKTFAGSSDRIVDYSNGDAAIDSYDCHKVHSFS